MEVARVWKMEEKTHTSYYAIWLLQQDLIDLHTMLQYTHLPLNQLLHSIVCPINNNILHMGIRGRGRMHG